MVNKCFNYWCECSVEGNEKYCNEQCRRFANFYRNEYGIESNVNNGKALVGNGHLRDGAKPGDRFVRVA